MVKNLPAMWETWVPSLGWEDPLEKGVKWLPTPVFLPGESHGQRSLVGYSPWRRKELDTASLSLSFSFDTNSHLFLIHFISFSGKAGQSQSHLHIKGE